MGEITEKHIEVWWFYNREEYWKEGKTLKEDYIHSVINEHEPDEEE